MLKTTIAGLRARKLRLFTTSFAVLLGVAFICGSLVLTDTIGRTFNDLFADVNKGTDAYVRGKSTLKNEEGDDARSLIDAATLDQVKAVPGVRAADAAIQGYAQLVDTKGKVIGNP